MVWIQTVPHILSKLLNYDFHTPLRLVSVKLWLPPFLPPFFLPSLSPFLPSIALIRYSIKQESD